MKGRLREYLDGYLWVRLEGPGLEALLRQAVEGGVSFRHLQRRGEQMTGRIPPRDLVLLRPLLRQSGCRIRVLGRGGAPAGARGIRRHRVFWAGALTLLMLLYGLSLFAWRVEVVGGTPPLRREVRTAAYALGLRPGFFLGAMDRRSLEHELFQRVSRLGWVGITTDGVLLQIHVAGELIRPPAPTAAAAEVVARRTALVTRVVVFRGAAAVSPGQMVEKGQVLIAGSGQGALGEVEGRVWLKGSAPVVDVRTVRSPLPGRGFRVGVSWKGKGILQTGLLPSGRGTVAVTGGGSWRIPFLPVEMTWQDLGRQAVRRVRVPRRQAAEEAKRLALRRATAQLARGGTVLHTNVRMGPGRVTVTVEAEEPISWARGGSQRGG